MRGAKEKLEKKWPRVFLGREALHYICGHDRRKAKKGLLVVKCVRYCERTQTNSIKKKVTEGKRRLLETGRSETIYVSSLTDEFLCLFVIVSISREKLDIMESFLYFLIKTVHLYLYSWFPKNRIF